MKKEEMKKNEKFFLELIKKGIFKVYKNGNIYRCKKKVRYENKYRECKSILMKTKHNQGYIQLRVNHHGKNIYIFASRLIWIYFNGSISKKLEMNHRNGIKDDNKLSNLEIVTPSENVNHAFRTGLNYNGFGENSNYHKLKNKEVLKIKKLLNKGIIQRKIAKMFDVSEGCINAINCKRKWAWLN